MTSHSPQPRKDLVCVVTKRDGRLCWTPAKWFLSTPVQKMFVCGRHVQGWEPDCKFPITDEILWAMANFEPTCA